MGEFLFQFIGEFVLQALFEGIGVGSAWLWRFKHGWIWIVLPHIITWTLWIGKLVMFGSQQPILATGVLLIFDACFLIGQLRYILLEKRPWTK